MESEGQEPCRMLPDSSPLNAEKILRKEILRIEPLNLRSAGLRPGVSGQTDSAGSETGAPIGKFMVRGGNDVVLSIRGRSRYNHPSPSIPLPVEGRGKSEEAASRTFSPTRHTSSSFLTFRTPSHMFFNFCFAAQRAVWLKPQSGAKERRSAGACFRQARTRFTTSSTVSM